MAIDDTDDAPEQSVDLQDALHERPDAARRIGMGLQALYNALMECLRGPPRPPGTGRAGGAGRK
jgi:hypothetical protein